MINNLVIIVTPTYNRRKFLPYLISYFKHQDYPKDLLKLIILDDSNESNQDLILDDRITYIHSNLEKKPIGEKRNILNNLAKNAGAEYIACFDDDDYYPPDKISYSVNRLKESGYKICGSSTLLIYYPHLDQIYLTEPQLNKIYYGHAFNGTLLYHVNYLNNNSYDDKAEKSEETKFLRNFKVMLLQLPYEKTILCVAHNNNTVSKKDLVNYSKLTDINIKDYNLDNLFYKSLI